MRRPHLTDVYAFSLCLHNVALQRLPNYNFNSLIYFHKLSNSFCDSELGETQSLVSHHYGDSVAFKMRGSRLTDAYSDYDV